MSRLFVVSAAVGAAAALGLSGAAMARTVAPARASVAPVRPAGGMNGVLLAPYGIAWGRNARFRRREERADADKRSA